MFGGNIIVKLFYAVLPDSRLVRRTNQSEQCVHFCGGSSPGERVKNQPKISCPTL